MAWGVFAPLNGHQLLTASENELEIHCIQWFSARFSLPPFDFGSLPGDCVKGAEIVWHTVALCELSGLHNKGRIFQCKPTYH